VKLLFLTQVLDGGDAVLGFASGWVTELAERCEQVRVVALEVGDTEGLPGNVDWREVGRKGRIGRYLRYRGFLREALREDGFDQVLAHMVPRYLLLADREARRAGAGLHLWYTSKGVDRRLVRAAARADRVFTATEESLRVPAPGRVVTGHGIDLAHFDDGGEPPEEPARILGVGRLTAAKDPLTLLAAVAILIARGWDVHLDLVGGGLVSADADLVRRVDEQVEMGGLAGRVRVHGAVPWRDVPAFYRRSTVLVNASLTGSLDKVVLEAMACRRPVVSCSDAFPGVVEGLGARGDALFFRPGSAAELADRLEAILRASPEGRRALGEDLRAIAARDHELGALMARIVAEMEAAR
jgi:glycosyltransferase involved in cell wall biosynthesis